MKPIDYQMSNPIQAKLKDQLDLSRLKLQPTAPRTTGGPTSSSTSQSAAYSMDATSIEDLLLISLAQNSDGARSDLAASKDRLDGNNAQQDLVRQLRSLARDENKSGIRALIKANPFLENSELLGQYKSGSIDFDALRDDVDSQLESLNGLNSTLTFQLQVLATRAQQADNLRSTIFKKFSDAADRIIGNI